MKIRDQERKVCMVVLEELEKHYNGKTDGIEWLEDKQKNNLPVVELKFRIGKCVFAMEHTQIEAFSEQIAESKHLFEFLDLLVDQLEGKLPKPGYFTLSLSRGTITWTKEIRSVFMPIQQWILREAPLLQIGTSRTSPNHFISAIPADVPFEVSLYRWPNFAPTGKQLMIKWFSVDQPEEKRISRIQTALERKCHKLQVAKGLVGISVLVLESNDLSASNHVDIEIAVWEALKGRTDIPDYIYLAETEIEEKMHIRMLKQPNRIVSSAGAVQ